MSNLVKQSSRTYSPVNSKQAFERSVREIIIEWYNYNGREFFWRELREELREEGAKQPEPYLVLVSEIMLQQTQTSRVQEKLPVFISLFPTIHDLAKADNASIIRAWSGMGYNSRALRLRDCAKVVVERYGGQIPSETEELLRLPGVGAYTASAIAAFAYHRDTAVLDVNIRRVYSRLLKQMPTTVDVLPEADVMRFAEEIYPRGKASEWHQAVMDIGALFCTARQPKCSICPLSELCASSGKLREAKKQKRAEPSWHGTPNRIWRGRIVEILRRLEDDESMDFGELEQRLNKQFFSSILPANTVQNKPRSLFEASEEALQEETAHREQSDTKTNAETLAELLKGLERDGIVEILTAKTKTRQGNKRVSARKADETQSTHSFFHVSLRLAKG